MTSGPRRVLPFGDTALVVEAASVTEAHGLAHALSRAPDAVASGAGSGAGLVAAIEDVVVGYRSVTVITDPTRSDLDELAAFLGSVHVGAEAARSPRRIEIPVAFGGPDLDEVAAATGLSASAVVNLLVSSELRVAFLGFLPGFAYLDGLPPLLQALDRRPDPRTSVPAGSLGLAGGFAAVYPRRSPGGWHLVGRSGMALFDPEHPPYAALQPGDVVRFVETDDPGEPPEPARARIEASGVRTVTVEDSGIASTVQDLGRRRAAALGVPRAGAADPYALRVANRAVGNAEAAGIEMTVRGPVVRFGADAHFVIVGTADVSVDGRPVPSETVVPVTAGQLVSVGEILGDLRSYLAVDGAIDNPMVLGSHSSDVVSGLGPGPLRAGDRLALGVPSRPRGRVSDDGLPGGRADVRVAGPGMSTVRVARVIAGPDPFDEVAVARLASQEWEVSVDSDRVGVRLLGPEPLAAPLPGIASRGMVTGALQVPPGGSPVALGCDHATVGGYPVAACVVSADVGVLGRCRPGDRLRLELVDLAEARAARASVERAVQRAAVGWYPVETA